MDIIWKNESEFVVVGAIKLSDYVVKHEMTLEGWELWFIKIYVKILCSTSSAYLQDFIIFLVFQANLLSKLCVSHRTYLDESQFSTRFSWKF